MHLRAILSELLGVQLKKSHILGGQHDFQLAIADANQFHATILLSRIDLNSLIHIIIEKKKNGTPKNMVIFIDGSEVV